MNEPLSMAAKTHNLWRDDDGKEFVKRKKLYTRKKMREMETILAATENHEPSEKKVNVLWLKCKLCPEGGARVYLGGCLTLSWNKPS